MKKLTLSSFEQNAVKSEDYEKLKAGSELINSEGHSSTTSKCTQEVTTRLGDVEGDTNHDGDWYASC